MYNEPNITFWRPQPNVDDYAKLALAVGKALRQNTIGDRALGTYRDQAEVRRSETARMLVS